MALRLVDSGVYKVSPSIVKGSELVKRDGAQLVWRPNLIEELIEEANLTRGMKYKAYVVFRNKYGEVSDVFGLETTMLFDNSDCVRVK